MRLAIKMLTLLALLWPAAASAVTFEGRRGINMDLWVTWPDEEKWKDPYAVFPFPEWRKHVGTAELKAAREAGFDFVRMPVDPSIFLSVNSRGYVGELLEDIREAVDDILESGLNVVVDLHAIPSGPSRAIGTREILADETMVERYLVLVRDVGRVLVGVDPKRVAFELMNEPVAGCEGEEGRAWAEGVRRLFAAGRASATRLTLVLSGACWASAEGLAALDPGSIPDENILWTFHSYEPFLLTHQGATWAGDVVPHLAGLPWPPHGDALDTALDRVVKRIRADASFTRRGAIEAYVREELQKLDTPEKLSAALRKPFDTVAAWADKHGIARDAILLGEFGMIRLEWGNDHVVPAADRAAYYRDMIGLAEDAGFRWSIWSWGGAFGVFEQFEAKPAEPDVLDMVRALPRR